MDLEKLDVPRALLKVCHYDTPVLSPLKKVSLLYNSLPLHALCASSKTWHCICSPQICSLELPALSQVSFPKP